jgi:single-strand DNA-binding protein
MVEGRLKLDTWDDKTSGQKRSKLKVVADNFQFLGGRPEGEAAPVPSNGSTAVVSATPPPPPTDTIDEDVPF